MRKYPVQDEDEGWDEDEDEDEDEKIFYAFKLFL